ncbi:MAG: hypothetical protein HYZ75_11015 [Elusimicrobia bacterium]|nr:hypothetical protein [Elusimicrobiota bacterium]
MRSLLLSLCLASEAAAKIGLSANLGDIVLEGARPGRTYNLREANGVALRIINTGDDAAKVMTEVTLPDPKRLRDGYLPLPDPSWVQVLPERYELVPGGVAFVDIILRLPDDPSLVGKNFQFNLFTHHDSRGFLAAGLETRVRLSLGKGPETLAKEKADKQMATFNFDLYPQTVYVTGAEAGTRYDAKAREKKSVRVINKADDPLTLVVKSVPWPGSVPLPEGYAKAPDPAWLKLRASTVAVEGLAIADMPFDLEIPAGKEGARYAFWLQPSLPTGLEFLSGAKVLVTVAAKAAAEKP